LFAPTEKSNLIGWRETLTTSPLTSQSHSRASKFAKWKTGFKAINTIFLADYQFFIGPI
jgi:hypothetical protein